MTNPTSRTVYGEIPLPNGHGTFRYHTRDGSEVYGWVENDYCLVPGTSGWYRTTNPQTAADAAFGTLEADRRRTEFRNRVPRCTCHPANREAGEPCDC